MVYLRRLKKRRPGKTSRKNTPPRPDDRAFHRHDVACQAKLRLLVRASRLCRLHTSEFPPIQSPLQASGGEPAMWSLFHEAPVAQPMTNCGDRPRALGDSGRFAVLKSADSPRVVSASPIVWSLHPRTFISFLDILQDEAQIFLGCD